MTAPICSDVPLWRDSCGYPLMSPDTVLSLLRALASVAETSDDPAAFAAVITQEADALECRVIEYARPGAH